MKIKIKLQDGATIPKYAKVGDAGLDLTAVSVRYDEEDDYIEYDSGVSVEIPEGYVGLVFPRSSISNYDLRLTNSVGVIDSGYRNTIKGRFLINHVYLESAINTEWFDEELQDGKFLQYYDEISQLKNQIGRSKIYKVGERFAQLMIIPYPQIEFEEVSELSETDRGKGGYGSTNR